MAKTYKSELQALRHDLRDGAISVSNFKRAVNEVLERKHKAKTK